MTATDHTDETTDEQIIHPESGMILGSLGEASVQIDIDQETYERVHKAYCHALDRGYSEGFDTFAFNHCMTSSFVTVDGEPVDPTKE